VICEEAGEKTVPGLLGYLNCPEPQQFCARHGSNACYKGCYGRGTCENGICECDEDYFGFACQYSNLTYEEPDEEDVFIGCCSVIVDVVNISNVTNGTYNFTVNVT